MKSRFGMTRVLMWHEKLHSDGFNVFVSFFYSAYETKELIETDLFIFDKDKSFNENLSTLKMENAFPHHLLYTYFYTDNRKKIPKDFLPLVSESKNLFNFSD